MQKHLSNRSRLFTPLTWILRTERYKLAVVVPEFVLSLVFFGFFFSIAALEIADYNHPSLTMIIDTQAMIGRFYKFKPRSQWRIEAKIYSGR